MGSYSYLQCSFCRTEALPSAEESRRRRRSAYSFGDFDDWAEQEERLDATFGEPNATWAQRRIRQNEAEHLAGILFEPPTDPEVTTQRQEIIRALAASPHLDRLIELKNQSYDMLDGLWTFWTWHGQKYHEEYFILNTYYEGVTKMPDWDEEDRFSSRPTRHINIPKIVHNHVRQIQTGTQAFNDFGRVAQETDDPAIQRAFSAIPQVTEYDLQQMKALKVPLAMQPVVPGQVYFGDYARDQLNNFHGRVLESQLFSVGAAVELAKRVRDHGWAEVTFDLDQPAGYKGGWNITR